MPPVKPFSSVDAGLPGFQRSLRKLPPEIRSRANDAISDLLLDQIPGALDFKKLKGYKNPNVYTITIVGNHSYKLSLEVSDGVATLRRVGTHKEIDEHP